MVIYRKLLFLFCSPWMTPVFPPQVLLPEAAHHSVNMNMKLLICSAGCLLKWWGRVLCLRTQQQEPEYNIWSVSQNNESPAPSPDCCHILKEATLTTLSSLLHLALWISSSLSLEETHSGTDSMHQWDFNTVHRMNWSVQRVQMETPGRWPLFDFRSQWLDSEICCLQHQVTGYKTAACCCWRRG